MNPSSRLIVLVLLMLSLPACAGKAEATATKVLPISDIHTAAVRTLTAQVDAFTPTALASPAVSPAIWASPTITTITPISQIITSPYPTATGCYNAAYISDVTIPDGSMLAPGEAFTKTWKFQNTGSCGWDADFMLAYETGADMDGADTFIGRSVEAGGTASLSLSLVAPETEGSYTGYWRLTTGSGEAFGVSVFVLILVSEEAATPTPEYTSTPTNTATFVDDPTNTPSLTPSSEPAPATEEKIVETSPETPTAVEEELSQPDNE